MMRGEVESYLELATDYLHAGFHSEAIDVLEQYVATAQDPSNINPLVHYYLGYLQQQLGQQDAAVKSFALARQMPVDYCFPYRLETIDVLQAALAVQPDDARAEYLLGNLLFDLQPAAALAHWERSRELDPSLAIVHRNLGWAYNRFKNDVPKAIERYEQALSCSQVEPRLLLELDQLYQDANVDPQRRMAALQAHRDVVARREETRLREITVQVLVGQYEQALASLENNFFHAQEGRDEIHDVYVDAHLLLGLQLLAQGQAETALQHFQKAADYPENLSVGRPKNDPRAPQIAYCAGLACEALGQTNEATQHFTQSASQTETDAWPETRFYQAQSLAKLGDASGAAKIYDQLAEDARKRLEEQGSADFFAKFGQEQSRRSRLATAHYLLGLALSGKGSTTDAARELTQAVEMNLSHPWARYQLEQVRK